MRKQLRKCDFVFARSRKLGPELGHASVDVDLIFLQDMQRAGATDSFRCRPDENDRIRRPWMFATRVPKATVKIDKRFSILPNGNRRAEFPKFFKIFAKERVQALAQFAWVQLHRSRLTREGRLPSRPFRRSGD